MHTCYKWPESSQYVFSEIEEDARSSESQSTGNTSYDLCSIFLQRFEVFQGVRDGVQLILDSRRGVVGLSHNLSGESYMYATPGCPTLP